jgi:endonuclease/exonuclease/phosphatase family metal-dependent hydrolase
VQHSFSIASLNMHKGLSPLNRRVIVHDLKAELDVLKPDVVCLQEVQGHHARHAARFADWPAGEQSDFLASAHWPEVHYARNAVYEHGHHGNAILSRFKVESAINDDMSMHRYERRGLLHTVLLIRGARVHCFCVHLGLTEKVRQGQMEMIADTVANRVPANEPAVLAGDFNDWRNRIGKLLAQTGFVDSFAGAGSKPPRTFPGRLPLLRLDRIYVRGLQVEDARVLHHLHRLSDHIGLFARLTLR